MEIIMFYFSRFIRSNDSLLLNIDSHQVTILLLIDNYLNMSDEKKFYVSNSKISQMARLCPKTIRKKIQLLLKDNILSKGFCSDTKQTYLTYGKEILSFIDSLKKQECKKIEQTKELSKDFIKKNEYSLNRNFTPYHGNRVPKKWNAVPLYNNININKENIYITSDHLLVAEKHNLNIEQEKSKFLSWAKKVTNFGKAFLTWLLKAAMFKKPDECIESKFKNPDQSIEPKNGSNSSKKDYFWKPTDMPSAPEPSYLLAGCNVPNPAVLLDTSEGNMNNFSSRTSARAHLAGILNNLR